MWFRNMPKTPKCLFYIVITICFERSHIFNVGFFWSPFGSLLELLFHTFGKKVGFGSSKARVNKTQRKLMKKGSQKGMTKDTVFVPVADGPPPSNPSPAEAPPAPHPRQS